jgi:hypothetical protein
MAYSILQKLFLPALLLSEYHTKYSYMKLRSAVAAVLYHRPERKKAVNFAHAAYLRVCLQTPSISLNSFNFSSQ